jgi:hypothetical protein
MNKIRRIDSIFKKKRKNIDNSQPSKSTPVCNVEVMVEQPQCASVYEEPALIKYILLYYFGPPIK